LLFAPRTLSLGLIDHFWQANEYGETTVTRDKKYTIKVRGDIPVDLREQISQLHAEAILTRYQRDHPPGDHSKEFDLNCRRREA
jgi:hypothetical protein